MELNREQVVKALERWMKNYDDKVTNFITLGNALGLIEELVEENERLQDLVKELQQYNEAWVEDNGRLRRDVKAIKADVVEVRHGEWRFKEYGEDTYTNLTRVYECSLCGRTIECLNEADEPYCHCGAKMDG